MTIVIYFLQKITENSDSVGVKIIFFQVPEITLYPILNTE